MLGPVKTRRDTGDWLGPRAGGDRRLTRALVCLGAVLWLGSIGLSLLALNQPAGGGGFLGGYNRFEGFLTWQLAAFGPGLLGAMALRLTPGPHPRLLKILGYGPIAVSAILALALAMAVAWAAFSPPAPAAPANALPPTTTPPPRS